MIAPYAWLRMKNLRLYVPLGIKASYDKKSNLEHGEFLTSNECVFLSVTWLLHF